MGAGGDLVEGGVGSELMGRSKQLLELLRCSNLGFIVLGQYMFYKVICIHPISMFVFRFLVIFKFSTNYSCNVRMSSHMLDKHGPRNRAEPFIFYCHCSTPYSSFYSFLKPIVYSVFFFVSFLI